MSPYDAVLNGDDAPQFRGYTCPDCGDTGLIEINKTEGPLCFNIDEHKTGSPVRTKLDPGPDIGQVRGIPI